MSLVPDEYVFAPKMVREFTPLIHSHLPGAFIDSDGHDLTVEYAGAELVPVEVAYRIVRALRGGADHDATKAADWHVRSLQPIRQLPEPNEDQNQTRPIIGTSIWFSQRYILPDGYDETNLKKPRLLAPGMNPPIS